MNLNRNRTHKNMKKKITLLSLAIISLAGCAIEEPQPETDNPFLGQEITIQAALDGNPESKTIRDASDGAVLWTPGDAISLFYGSGTAGGSRFVSNATEPTAITNFTGTITAITGGADVSLEDTYFWGVYPYSDDVTCDGSSVTLTVPSQQTAVPGTFAPGAFPSLGRSQGLVMGFYNICGGWSFSVTKEGVRKVTLQSNGGEPITGRVKVRFGESKVPVVQEVIDGSDQVVLECPPGEYFEVGTSYYIALLPTVLSSGLSVTFETYTEEGVYNRTVSTTINRSRFANINNLDNYLTTPYAQKVGNIPIPDANFKAYLVANFDSNSDGEISYAEAAAITEIDTRTTNISSVQGIEYMANLTTLNISNPTDGSWFGGDDPGSWTYGCDSPRGLVSELDISNNPALRSINCEYNQITKVDTSNNPALEELQCSYNAITALNISRNSFLSQLDCSRNPITSLNTSYNPDLSSLNCEDTQLSTLDVSNNIALGKLYLSRNLLTTLDVSNNSSLFCLDVYGNCLTSLDVSNNTRLSLLSCSINQLSSLDVSNNTVLRSLYCGMNQLSSLDVSHNTALKYLSCGQNQIASIDVSNIPTLVQLECSGNLLESLDVSNNTSLKRLSCDGNQLTVLDVSNNPSLDYLICNSNQLTTLDITNNTALTFLKCFFNQLTTLDVSNNTSLTDLDCSPMSTLETLFIYQNQEIPKVTVDRNDKYIPAGTQIVVAPGIGGNEGTGNDPINP